MSAVVTLHQNRTRNAQNRVNNIPCYFRPPRTFDEATGSLDNQSYQNINRTLEQLQLDDALPNIDVRNPHVLDGTNLPFVDAVACRNYIAAYVPAGEATGPYILIQRVSGASNARRKQWLQ